MNACPLPALPPPPCLPWSESQNCGHSCKAIPPPVFTTSSAHLPSLPALCIASGVLPPSSLLPRSCIQSVWDPRSLSTSGTPMQLFPALLSNLGQIVASLRASDSQPNFSGCKGGFWRHLPRLCPALPLPRAACSLPDASSVALRSLGGQSPDSYHTKGVSAFHFLSTPSAFSQRQS